MKYKVIKDYYIYGEHKPIYMVGQEFEFDSKSETCLVMLDDGHGCPHYFDLDEEFLEHFELVG